MKPVGDHYKQVQLYSVWSSSNLDPYTASTVVDTDSIRVSWRRSNDPLVELQLQSVLVVVTSDCLTGIVPPTTQNFTITSDVGNSLDVTEIGKSKSNTDL